MSHGSLYLSTMFLLAFRWGQRALGLISTIVLARLLTPEDFGVVALASIIVHFFNGMADVGSEQYIIQKKFVSNNDISSAWTLDILMKGGLWLVLFLLSDWIVDTFLDVDVSNVISFLSIFILVEALQNPGLFLLRRRLEYKDISKLEMTAKIVGFTATISTAYIYHSYWAIVAGSLVHVSTRTVGSYFIAPFKYALCFNNFKEQFKFSRWIFLTTIAGWLKSQADNFIISTSFGAAGLGRYNLLREITLLPATELVNPISQPLLASISSMRTNPSYRTQMIRVLYLVIISFCSVISSYIALFSEPLVGVLLGSQWIDSHTLMRAFIGLYISVCIGVVTTQVLVALGEPKKLFLHNAVLSMVLIGTLILLKGSEMQTISYAVGFVSLVGTIAILISLEKKARIGIVRVLRIGLPIILMAPIIAFSIKYLYSGEDYFIKLVITGASHCLFSLIYSLLVIKILSRKVPEYAYIYGLILRLKNKIER